MALAQAEAARQVSAVRTLETRAALLALEERFDQVRQRSLVNLQASVAANAREAEQLRDQYVRITAGNKAVEERITLRYEDAAAAAEQLAATMALAGESDAEVQAQQRIAQGLREIIALRGAVAGATADNEAAAAAKAAAAEHDRAAQDAARAWHAAADDIRGSLTDALRRAFESGEDFGTAMAKVIEREIKARVASAMAGMIFDSVAGLFIGSAVAAGRSASDGVGMAPEALRGLQAGKGLYDISAGFGAIGAKASNLYATTYANMTGTGLDGMLAANNAFGTSGSASTSAAGTFGSVASTAAGVMAGVYGGRMISGGYAAPGSDSGNSYVNSGTAIGTAVGAYFGMPAVGAAVGGWVGGLVNRAIGHKRPEVESREIAGTFTAGDFSGDLVNNIRAKGGWLIKSDKRWSESAAVTGDIDKALDEGGRQIVALARRYGDALGLPLDALADVSQQIRITITGDIKKDGDALDAVLQEYAGKLFDTFAGALEPLRLAEETIAQTIERVGGAIAGVNEVLGALGLTTLQASIDGGAAALALQEAFGGMSTLQQAAGSYLQNYYSDAERADLALKAIGETLADVGLKVPDTRDAFRELVQAQDLTTQSGRETFAVLMGVADAFAAVVKPARAAADILAERQQLERELLQLQGDTAAIRALERAALDASNRALYDQIKALEGQQAAAKLAADYWTQLTANAPQGVQSAYAAVAQAVDAERQQVQSSTEQAIRLAQSRADGGIRALEQQASTIETTFSSLARAMADQAQRLDGVLAGDGGRAAALQVLRNGAAGALDVDALRQAAGTAAQINTGDFATALDYRRAVSETSALLRRVGSAASGRQAAELAAIAAQQVAIEKASAEEIAALEAARDAQLYVLDQQLAEARAQASTLVRIDERVQSVAGAISALASAITAARALQGQQAPAGDTGRWLYAGSTEVWQAAGGAVAARQAGATMDGTLIKGLASTFTAAEARAFVADRLQSGDITGIYARAVAEGIDSASLDALMGWAPGTSLAEARRRGLPAFAVGTPYVPQTGPAIVHEGERILTAADNAELMRIMRGDGGGAALVAEVRRLREEMESMRKENAAAQAAIASHTNRTGRLLDDVVNGGASLATRAEA